MRKFRLIIALLVFACLSLTMGFACSKKPEEPDTITGFNIEAEINVNAGDIVSLVAPLVVDQDGNVMDIHVSVTDNYNGYVEVKANKFFALDGNGYTIRYVVQTYDGALHEKTTKVNVTGNFYLGLDMQQVYFIGDEVTLNALHRLEDPTITFAVTDPDGQEVLLDNNQFTIDKAGFYTVDVSATDNGKPYAYEGKLYVYSDDIPQGAVEIFDENWIDVRKLSGYGLQNWRLTNTEECGILSWKGTPDHFIAATTTSGWQGGLDFWLNPIFDKDNYESLVAKGYEKVIIPVFLDANVDSAMYTFTTGHVQNDTSYMYQLHVGGLHKNEWKLMEIKLADSYQDWTRSFLSAFDYYEKQIAQFLRFTGTNGDITHYIGSIYVMKDTDVTKNVEDLVILDVGTEKVLNSMFACADSELEFAVTFRGKTEILSASQSNYKFNANGEYLVTAYPKSADLKGSASVTIVVEDMVSLSFTESSDVEYPRDPAGVRIVNFADLGAILTDGNGDAIADVSYEVYFGEEKIDIAENDFTASKDGKYTVWAVGKYGNNLVAYKDFIVNIYSVTNLSMVDVQEVSSINIANEINTKMEYAVPKSFVSYKLVKIVGLNEVELDATQIIVDGVLDVTKIPDGYYKVYATDTNGVDELVYFDRWDSEVGHLWNVVSEDNLDYVQALGSLYQKKIGYAYKDKELTQKAVEVVDEKGKTWYKYSHTDNYPLYMSNGQPFTFLVTAGIEVKPLHSKEYYETLNAQGYKVYFDVMFVKKTEEGNPKTLANLLFNTTAWAQWGNLESGTIYSANGDRILLDSLVTNYDYIVSGTTIYDEPTRNFIIGNYWSAHTGHDAKDVDIYVSDIRLAASVNVSTEIYLADENGNYKETADDVITSTQSFNGNLGVVYAGTKQLGDYQVDFDRTSAISKKITSTNDVYFRVFYKRIPSQNVGLVDVKSTTTLDVKTLIDGVRGEAGEYSSIQLYNALSTGDVLVDNAVIENGVLTTTGLDGIYFVEGVDQLGDKYRARFEAYNLDNAIWNVFSVNNFAMYSENNTNDFKVDAVFDQVKVTNPNNGQEYDAIKIEKSDMKSMAWYVMNPLHSKAYYEMLAQEGYTLTYSVYFDAPAGSDPMNQYLGYGYQLGTTTNLNVGGTVAKAKFNSNRCSVEANKGWYTVTADLTYIVENWDKITNPNWRSTDGQWGTRNQYGFFHTYNPKTDLTMYVSGFELTKNA